MKIFGPAHSCAALESPHVSVSVIKRAPKMHRYQIIIANLSGRGDKDVAQAAEFLPAPIPR